MLPSKKGARTGETSAVSARQHGGRAPFGSSPGALLSLLLASCCTDLDATGGDLNGTTRTIFAALVGSSESVILGGFWRSTTSAGASRAARRRAGV